LDLIVNLINLLILEKNSKILRKLKSNFTRQKKFYRFKKNIKRIFGRHEDKEEENLHLVESFVKNKSIRVF